MFAVTVWASLLPPLPLALIALVLDGPGALLTPILAPTWKGWFVLFYTVVPVMWLGYLIWGTLLRTYPAAKVGPISLLVPCTALVFAAAAGRRADRRPAAARRGRRAGRRGAGPVRLGAAPALNEKREPSAPVSWSPQCGSRGVVSDKLELARESYDSAATRSTRRRPLDTHETLCGARTSTSRS